MKEVWWKEQTPRLQPKYFKATSAEETQSTIALRKNVSFSTHKNPSTNTPKWKRYYKQRSPHSPPSLSQKWPWFFTTYLQKLSFADKKNKIKSNPKKYIQRPPLCYRSVLRKNEGRNLLKNISLLYCDWHLTVLSGVLTWMNLNDKLSFISNRALFTIEQHDYFMERKKRKNQSFPSIPRGTPDLSPGYDLPSLIHANRMALICSTGRFATPLNSGISYGMTPTSHGVQITFMLLAFSIRWQMTSPPFWDKADHLALQTTFWLTSRQKPAVFCLLVWD